VKHPDPFRTRPLSTVALMVLHLKVWESKSPPNLINNITVSLNDDKTLMTRDGAARSTGKTLHWRLLKPASPRQAHNLTKQHAPKDAGWSSPVARQAHNLKVAGSNPAPATKSFLTITLT
jgi:hypothetical protein